MDSHLMVKVEALNTANEKKVVKTAASKAGCSAVWKAEPLGALWAEHLAHHWVAL